MKALGSADGRLLVLIPTILVAILALGFAVYIPLKHVWNSYSTRKSLSSNCRYYEAVVDAVRRDGLKRSESAVYQVPHDWDYNSLTRVNTSGFSWDEVDRILNSISAVQAYVNNSEVLIIRFKGHARGYGLLYTSRILNTEQLSPYIGPGTASPLKPHWWMVLSD
jgi:hypothetical protein